MKETKQRKVGKVMSKIVKRVALAVVAVFMLIMACIMVGDAKIAYCGVYKPWKWNANKIWFVENTCRDIHFTPKE